MKNLRDEVISFVYNRVDFDKFYLVVDVDVLFLGLNDLGYIGYICVIFISSYVFLVGVVY